MHANRNFEKSCQVLEKLVKENQTTKTSERNRMTELEKLQEIFQKVDPDKQRLVEKLLHDAAFLSEQNEDLRKMIEVTGMVKFHPTNPNLQKPTEAAKQYLRNLQTYSVVIKTLNQVFSKNSIEEQDDFEQFMNQSIDEAL